MTTDLPSASLLVTDLDNTAWDWFDAWYKSFAALLDGLVGATGISRNELERAIRPIHQRRGTSEYSWLLEELQPGVLSRFAPSGTDVRQVFEDALHRQNSARKHNTLLYPGVLETMNAIRAKGVPIVAYTESVAYWTEWRMRTTGLDGVIDVLYSSPDHDVPAGVDVAKMRKLDAEDYGLRQTEHRHTPGGLVKPSTDILNKIIEEAGVAPTATVYVGDSLMKDVAMAQSVGVIDVYAEYGDSHLDTRYSQLQAVSHWPDADVSKEQNTTPGVLPTPTITLSKSFAELTRYVHFEGPRG